MKRFFGRSMMGVLMITDASYSRNLRNSRLRTSCLQSRLWDRNDFEKPPDDFFRCDALRLGMEVRQNAVTENRIRQRLDILNRYVVASVNQGSPLAAETQELRCAQTPAIADVSLYEVGW